MSYFYGTHCTEIGNFRVGATIEIGTQKKHERIQRLQIFYAQPNNSRATETAKNSQKFLQDAPI